MTGTLLTANSTRNVLCDLQNRDKSPLEVALLTGGSDRPYVYGLMTCLIQRGVRIDLIGSDELDLPEFQEQPGVRFLNLRGSTRADASAAAKFIRILKYYLRLMAYAATGRPKIFHILWNNKFEAFDRVFLMLYYKVLGKKIAFTAHNINAARRDGNDSWFNRATLRSQYRLADRLFVHTENMRNELVSEFAPEPERVTTIPFGINNSVPDTELTLEQAKERLGIRPSEKAILFFGRITPYKGLEYLVRAFRQLTDRSRDYCLILAGRPDNCESYWNDLRAEIDQLLPNTHIVLNCGYVPDADVEVYFKAADALVLPYRDIYQSGVLFLGQSFGLPVLATDVGSLRSDIEEGWNGFLFRSEDGEDLARTVERYFASEIYLGLARRRQEIRERAVAAHSWNVVADITMESYRRLLASEPAVAPAPQDVAEVAGCARAASHPAVPVRVKGRQPG